MPGNFCDSFAPLAFLLLLWDGMFKTDIVKFLHPNSSPQLLGAMSPHTSRAWELPAAASHARSPDPAAGAASAPRAPLPPSPAPQPESPDVGFHPCAWYFISIKGQCSEGPRLRPPPPPAALPRGARRPGPARARAAPAGARPAENREEGAEAGRLRAVLRGGGRGGERGWGGGRSGAGTPLAAAGGFVSLRAATRAPPASSVAAGAGREEHGEGRGGRSGARRARRGHPGRGADWRARAQRRQVKASESARRALRAEAGDFGCCLARAPAPSGVRA